MCKSGWHTESHSVDSTCPSCGDGSWSLPNKDLGACVTYRDTDVPFIWRFVKRKDDDGER